MDVEKGVQEKGEVKDKRYLQSVKKEGVTQDGGGTKSTATRKGEKKGCERGGDSHTKKKKQK